MTVKAVACVMFGMGGAIFDPAGGETVLVQKIKALGVDTAASPYQCTDSQAIANVLMAAHAQGARLIVGGDSLGANNGPYIAQSLRTHLGLDYLFGFQPSEYGQQVTIPRSVVEARCIYNPNFFATFGLGAYEWQLEPGNVRTKLRIVTNNDMHPGDDDVAMQNLVLADIQRIIAS